MALKVSRLIPEPVDGLGTRAQGEHSFMNPLESTAAPGT